MSTARELARRGLSVCLFDKGDLGQEASWAAGGILSSMRPWAESGDSAALSGRSQACYPAFTESLRQETGIDPEYYPSGIALISPDDIAATLDWAQANGIPHVRNYCPAGMSVDALLLPEIAQVRVPRLLQALHRSLERYRVSIFEHTAVTQINISGSRFQSVTAETGEMSAGAIVIAAGAWTGRLLSDAGRRVDIVPVLGQMLCLRFAEQRLDNMILDGERYFIPRRDGHLLIGSTLEQVGFEKHTTREARDSLMAWAGGLFPEVRDAGFVRHWSGLRPAAGPGSVYLGRLPGHDNVFINAGHFRKGILQAPACADRIAELICRNGPK